MKRATQVGYSGYTIALTKNYPQFAESRGKCLTCGRSRKWFCYTCLSWTTSFNGDSAPNVQLPFTLHVLKHNIEISGKSTAIHAAMLVESECLYRVYPDIPDYREGNPGDHVWVLYPGKEARSVKELVHEAGCTNIVNDSSLLKEDFNLEQFCKLIKLNILVIIDGTWSQMHSFLQDGRIKGAASVKFVKLGEQYTTKFWRPQGKLPVNYLATIEALFYFMKELQIEFWKTSGLKEDLDLHSHDFDDLLYFYDFMLQQVVNRK
ncbi:tRNA-uridine aminocarboxypropyltransferase 1-like isoform X2 [Convolutriloba macropyga]|uniref:tRNA-uridine aminocarboxypropyltransferase 1-like isoform X2 n=1 Tax=Convolutriloba macropyga TaxID=536237 RepID=UPI003F525371